MVGIVLKNLDKDSLYTQVLRVSEYLCEEFHISKSFGIISQANQSVVDYVLGTTEDFDLEMQIYVEGNKISISFISPTPIFDHILEELKLNSPYHHDFTLLANNFAIKSNNKEVTYSFHVKPFIKTERYLPVGILQHKRESQ